MRKNAFICIAATAALLIIILFNINGLPAKGDINESISQMENEINENESRYNEIQNKLTQLENSKENLAEYVVKLNESYTYILSVIDDLDKQISSKSQELDNIDEKISETENQLKEQYDLMSLRIQFLYESNSTNFIESILSAQDFEELINQISYYNDIVEYDRSELDKLQSSMTNLNNMKTELSASIEELNGLKAEQDKQKVQLEALMAEASTNISNHQAQIDEAESVAAAMVEEMEAKRNSIEELKKEEERRLAELARKESMEAAGEKEEKIPYAPIDGDLRRLAAIIYCEARGEPYEGQVAVATVVMNRVESTRFPNTVEEVIAQPNQFTPYGMGLYAIALAKDDMQQSCIDAAREVLENGVRSGDWLFFRTINNIVQGTYIGHHVFY